jgi:hypothetical protein
MIHIARGIAIDEKEIQEEFIRAWTGWAECQQGCDSSAASLRRSAFAH